MKMNERLMNMQSTFGVTIEFSQCPCRLLQITTSISSVMLPRRHVGQTIDLNYKKKKKMQSRSDVLKSVH